MQRYDDLLLPFMKSSNEAEASRLLEQLLSHHAYPIVRRIIGSKLRVYTNELFNNNSLQDLEDVIDEVMLQLVERLQKFKSNPDSDSCCNFRSYVAVTAYNTFHSYLRKKYPHRWRLKNKLRYILTHKENFALWENNNNDWLCGFPDWRDQKKLPCSPDRLHQIITHTELHYQQSERNNPTPLLNSIFKLVDAPIVFDDLVNIIADLLEIREAIEEKNKDLESGLGSQLLLSSSPVSIATELEQRMYIQRLWAEICQLPLQQRLALLLNLRDAQGHDLMLLLAQARIATMGEIAESLEMTAEEFAHLWNRLPLDDATIASQLGASRQQVINLRSSARRRLSRRMKRFEQK